MNKRPKIVISGSSGRFANCANIEQLRDKLYKGIEMTIDNEERWPKGIFGLPSKSAVLMDFQNFDASFFGLTNEEADLIDPSTRFNIEVTFEALCDAGLNPWNLDKRKVGLFQAQTGNEMNNNSIAIDKDKVPSPQFVERLIAYLFNIKNGCFLYETACSSSFTAINQAYVQLTHGLIDLAIVSCANVMWTPAIALSYHRLGLTSQVGNCRFLDASASGYGRSETVACLILERSCDAQRIHGEIVFSHTNSDGYKLQGITYPSWQSQASLMRTCYKETTIDPSQLEYFECHGTGTEVGDMVETTAIWSVFGLGRENPLPLLLGSIKSNLGHSEAGSGLSSLIKCLLIFKSNSIPPNLHYEKPSPHIPELAKGFVAPVVKVTPFKGQFIPVNNFGFGGANGHIILGRSSMKTDQHIESRFDKEENLLLLCCGRNEAALQTMIKGIVSLKPEQITPHFVHLVNRYSRNMSSAPTPNRMMNHRSYIIVSRGSFKPLKVSPIQKLTCNTQAPICFAFPGAGCQMDNMIKPFMGLKPFRESIEHSLALIDPDGSKGVRKILFNARQSHWKIFAFGVFQIAVVDTLRSIEIVPDIIVGHSFGEYCCAYSDGVLTKSEVLDICYNNAQLISSIIDQSETFKSCSMISVSLTWDKLSSLIPDNLYPACYNTLDNITLAGYTQDIVQFSNHLKVQNVYHRLVDSCGFGFHTQSLGSYTDQLRERLTHYAKIARKKSDHWIISHKSSMIVNQPINIQTLAVDIIGTEVQFEKACQLIPKNAICIEIAPRKFLTTLLKCNLTESVIVEVPFKVGNQPFVQVDDNHLGINHQQQNSQFPDSLLHSLGNLYINGCTINLEPILSHQLIGPAPIDTPFLSPLIKLDHSVSHLVRRFPEYFNYATSSQEKFTIDTSKKDSKHLGCFHYNGNQMVPIAGLINLIWSKFASMTAQSTNDLAVRLERIKLHRLPLFDDEKLSVSFFIKFLPSQQEKYKFTITSYSDHLLIMTGFASVFDDSSGNLNDDDVNSYESYNESHGTGGDSIKRNIFYGILSRHGLHYQGDLRNVIQVNGDIASGVMVNNQDWMIRFESLLQFVNLSKHKGNSNNIPVRLDEIHCVPDRSGSLKESSTVTINYDKFTDTIRSESMYIRGVHLGSFGLPFKLNLLPPRLETFIPRFNQTVHQPLETCITIMVDHLIEFTNHQKSSITITTLCKTNGIKSKSNDQSFGNLIGNRLNQRRSTPCNWIKIDSLNQLTNTGIKNNTNKLSTIKLDDNQLDEGSTVHLLILETDETNLIDLITGTIISTLKNFDFILVRQSLITADMEENNYSIKLINHLKSNGLMVVSCSASDQDSFYLIRWSIDDPISIKNVTPINSTFQLPPFSNVIKFNGSRDNQQLYWLLVNNLSSSIGLIDSYVDQQLTNHQTIQLKWLINETGDDDIEQHYNELIPIGLKYTVLRNCVQGSYHYLPINLSSSSSSSSSPSSSSSSSKLLPTIGTTNWYHLNNSSLIQLLSPSYNDTPIVICCNQIADCDSILAYSKIINDGNQGEIGIVKYNQTKDNYLIVNRWAYNLKVWSLEQASTIPIPYSLAYYGLIFTGQLRHGETVLIVNGHSSVGCAMLTICLSLDCTIYLTVETPDQKVSLVNRYPQLADKQFLITTNSEEIEQTIKILTNGYGCDLVVNTRPNKSILSNGNNNNNKHGTGTNFTQVKGDLDSLLKCLCVGGRCVDLNKSPMSIDDGLGLAIFLQNIAYYGITPEGLFQLETETSGKSNHPNHRVADLLEQHLTKEKICPLIDVDSVEMIKIQPTPGSINSLPLIDLIIGQPGDIELEIIEKSRKHDKVSKFLLIPLINESTKQMTTFSSTTRGSSSSSTPTLLSQPSSSSSSSSSSYSLPLTSISSTHHQRQPLISTLTPPSNKSTPLNYHPYIINQLGLLGCSFVDISNSITGDKNTNITKYQQVLKEISKSYTINKVFLVYRSPHLDNNNNNNNQHFNNHHNHNSGNQLMIELLDYITNSREISINFLTLISCSLTQDCTFIWPQLVKKCQQYGKRTEVNSITINLTDLLSSDDPNYWSQLDQYISQLYCQLIGINDNRKDDNHNDNNRKVNGVYKLTCKVDNQ